MADLTLARVLEEVGKLGGDVASTLVFVNGVPIHDGELDWLTYRVNGAAVVDLTPEDGEDEDG